MRFFVTNQANNKKYPAEGQFYPEHGWHTQIFDFDPNAWGRARSGIGDGPVIDQGWKKDLEQRYWVFPEMKKPENIRNREIQRLAAGLTKPKQESLVDQLIPPLDEESQLEIGTKVEKEHFTKSGKPKDKTPRAVAKTHLGENPHYYPKTKKPRGSLETLKWVKEAEKDDLDNPPLSSSEKRELDLAKRLAKALYRGPVRNFGGIFTGKRAEPRKELQGFTQSDMYTAVRCLQRLGYGIERTDAGGQPTWELTSVPDNH